LGPLLSHILNTPLSRLLVFFQQCSGFFVHAWRVHGTDSLWDGGVGCLGQSPGEPPVCFLNWDTAKLERSRSQGTKM